LHSLQFREGFVRQNHKLLLCQLLEDMIREMILNLTMARHGLARSGVRVAVPIVTTPLADEYAAELIDLADEISAFHAM